MWKDGYITEDHIKYYTRKLGLTRDEFFKKL